MGALNLCIGNFYDFYLNTNGASDKFNRRGWSGYIDDVGIWNRIISLDEIKYLQLNSFKP
jgi:hypothetical protein